MKNLSFLLLGLICLAVSPQSAFSQNQPIAGKITDRVGNPVPGGPGVDGVSAPGDGDALISAGLIITK
jgi:hypothetical protein